MQAEARTVGLWDLQDAVVEDDEVADERISCGGGEEAVRCGKSPVDLAGERLSWRGACLSPAVSMPVAGEFLSRGADRCSVGWVAEIDDVESRDGVGGHDRPRKGFGTENEKTEPSRASTSYSAVTGSGAK